MVLGSVDTYRAGATSTAQSLGDRRKSNASRNNKKMHAGSMLSLFVCTYRVYDRAVLFSCMPR